MAREVSFKCQTNGQVFRLIAGPTRSTAGLPKEEIDKNTALKTEEFLNEIFNHSSQNKDHGACIVMTGKGFLD